MNHQYEEIAMSDELLTRAVKFEFGANSADFHDIFYVEKNGNKWSIKDGSFIYSIKANVFVLPEQDDEFKIYTKFNLSDAWDKAEKIEKEGKVAFQRRRVKELTDNAKIVEYFKRRNPEIVNLMKKDTDSDK